MIKSDNWLLCSAPSSQFILDTFMLIKPSEVLVECKNHMANGVPYTHRVLSLIWEINSSHPLISNVRNRCPCITWLFQVHSNLQQKRNAFLLPSVLWVCHSLGSIWLWLVKHLYLQFSTLVYIKITRGSLSKYWALTPP